jgi:chromosome segregation protein
MYLKRLEIQGFKTFAQKTILEFMPDRAGRRGVTAIVGPNGSGKSNIADALRWVMGEQSLKLLRGKKSEDVIFSGTEKRARSGFAEVTIVMENDRRGENDIEMNEIAITRRLYRDGQSEYEVNRQAARLQDVVLLLAQCGVGQRTYSVIGQGMIDHVLVSSPAERKEFFDEAFGLRPFQLKRHSAMNKMEESRKNLAQTEGLLREIGPRLTTLERQVKRLQERETLEADLKSLERAYYGFQWKEISSGIHAAGQKVERARAEQIKKEGEASVLEEELGALEKATPPTEGFRELQDALRLLADERAKLRERQMALEQKQAIAAVRAEKPWAPLPLSRIIESIDDLQKKHQKLAALLTAKKVDLEAIRSLAEELALQSSELVSKLQRPAPEPEKGPVRDPEIDRELAGIVEGLSDVARRTKEAEMRIESWNKEEEGKRSHVFELQHRLNRAREEARQAERKSSEAAIELARVETRREGFMGDLRMHAAHLDGQLDELSRTTTEMPGPDAGARLQRLRSQLEWIGGIDPETIKEHTETKERFEFLSKQTSDLRESINSLEVVVQELDTTIRERSATAFHVLNREFATFFKKLFNGGDARLEELMAEAETDEEGNVIQEADPNQVAGIEILATPPGKRFKSIALLSGGERALTSIALICAIMATNPSPFVVLDEVDAALDESNSRKFAEIIHDLADKTQFIVVTHNRATMTQANVLYGVTMGDDGVSQLLSVKVEDVEKMRDKQKG